MKATHNQYSMTNLHLRSHVAIGGHGDRKHWTFVNLHDSSDAHFFSCNIIYIYMLYVAMGLEEGDNKKKL